MSTRMSEAVSASRFISKCNGESQSAIIEANNNLRYLVKWKDSPQGAKAILHEILGTTLYEGMGLPVPQWTSMEVSDDFIDANPAMWLKINGKRVRLAAGMQFASLKVGDSPQKVLEILPGSWHSRILNCTDFWGALTVDVWAEHQSNRQALFIQNPGTPYLIAVFVDQKNMFGYAATCPKAQLRKCSYLDTRIYSRASMIYGLNLWIGRIQKYGPSAVARLQNMASGRGTETAVNRISERLLNRITRLDELIFPAIFQWLPIESEVSAFTTRRDTIRFRPSTVGIGSATS